MAEAVRFELTNGCPLPVFKTGALNHSATPPQPAQHYINPGPGPVLSGAERLLATIHHAPDERREDQLHRQLHLATGRDDRVGARHE